MKGPTLRDVVAVPVTAAVLARALSRHPDYRVASRLPKMERREAGPERTGELSVCVLHAHAFGPDRHTRSIIELSLQTVRVDQHGRIVDSGRNLAWFEDPGLPIPHSVSLTTGITDEDVRGRSISEGEAYGELATADVILCHEAFCRPLIERRLLLEAKPWICSRQDLDWGEHGLYDGGVRALLRDCDRFYEGAGAAAEVNALLHLLDHRLVAGDTVIRQLIRSAARSTWFVTIAGPGSEAEGLVARGYSWDADGAGLSKEMAEDLVEDEREWVSLNVYGGSRRPGLRRVTWRERHAAA